MQCVCHRATRRPRLHQRCDQKRCKGWSGSFEQGGALAMGAMEKEEQTGGRSITTDLENDHVMRTKRARRCRSVLFQRSTWTVSPVSRAHCCVLLIRNYRLGGCPEVASCDTGQSTPRSGWLF